MSVYSLLDSKLLMEEYVRLEKSIDDLEFDISQNEASSDGTMKNNVLKWRKSLSRAQANKDAVLEELEKKSKNSTVKSTNSVLSPPSSSINTMINYIDREVGKFDPTITPVSTFLSELKTAHDLYITHDQQWGSHLETYFLRAAKSRMDQVTLETLTAQNKVSFKSFKDFQTVLTEEFAHLSTGFQLFDTVWEMELHDNESMASLATRLNRQMSHAGTAIRSKFQAANGTDMTAQDAFDMFAALRFLEFIRFQHPDVHKQMAGSTLDKMFSVTAVANEATKLIQLYRDSDQSSHTLACRPGGSLMRRTEENKNRTKKPPKWFKGPVEHWQVPCPNKNCTDSECTYKHPPRNFTGAAVQAAIQEWKDNPHPQSQDDLPIGGSFVPHETVLQPMTAPRKF